VLEIICKVSSIAVSASGTRLGHHYCGVAIVAMTVQLRWEVTGDREDSLPPPCLSHLRLLREYCVWAQRNKAIPKMTVVELLLAACESKACCFLASTPSVDEKL